MMVSSEELIQKDCAGGCGLLAPLGAARCPDCDELERLLRERRAHTDLRNQRYAVPPRAEMGVILHHYPERQPVAEVFPGLTWCERLILMAIALVSTASATAGLYIVFRAIILFCLWLSAPAGSVVPR